MTTDSWNAGASPDPEGWRGSILRISPDDNKVERFATGIRSVHSMIFNDQDLLFVDNEGGGNPTEELNVALQGRFYGHNPIKYNNPSITKPTYDYKQKWLLQEWNLIPLRTTSVVQEEICSFLSYGPGERWNRGAIGRLKLARQSDSTYGVQEFPVAKGIPEVSDLAFGANGDLYVAHVGKTDYWYQPIDSVEGAFYRLIYDPGWRQHQWKQRLNG